MSLEKRLRQPLEGEPEPLTETQRQYLRDLAESCGTVGRNWLPAVEAARTREDGLRLRTGLRELRDRQRRGLAPREYVPRVVRTENLHE